MFAAEMVLSGAEGYIPDSGESRREDAEREEFQILRRGELEVSVRVCNVNQLRMSIWVNLRL